MVCLQTTHCAILLSLLGGRERVTEYSAPQWGQKKVPPSGTGPNRGTSAPPYTPNQYAPRREQIPAPSSPPRANPRSSSPVMMRSLTWSYPQKSPYSFDTAPAAAHRPRRVNTHSTKLQLLAHVHKRQKIPRSLLVCRHQNSTTRHHPARRRRSRPRLARLPGRLLPDTVKSCAGWSLPQASFMCLDFGG